MVAKCFPVKQKITFTVYRVRLRFERHERVIYTIKKCKKVSKLA